MKYSNSVALMAISLLPSLTAAQVAQGEQNDQLVRRTFGFGPHPAFGAPAPYGGYGGQGGVSGYGGGQYGGGQPYGGGQSYGGGSSGGYGGSNSEGKGEGKGKEGHHGQKGGESSSSPTTEVVSALADSTGTVSSVAAESTSSSLIVVDSTSSTLVLANAVSTAAVAQATSVALVENGSVTTSSVVQVVESVTSSLVIDTPLASATPTIVAQSIVAATTVESSQAQAPIETSSSSTSTGSNVVYGSGSSSMSSSGSNAVDACIQICQATNGQSGLVSSNTNSGSSTGSVSTGSTDTGSTNTGSTVNAGSVTASTTDTTSVSVPGTTTASDGSLVAGPGQVIVAPKKGDLRMVPFAIEAASGSVVTFVWGAGPHTVSQSSALEPCNSTLAPGSFKSSGQQSKGFTFPVTVVDASKPTYYFCGVGVHCEKGMYGIVNPTISTNVASSFGTYMDTMASTNTAFSQMMNETTKMCNGNSRIQNWGSTYDVAQLPSWALDDAMWNVLSTRQYYASNPSSLLALSAINSTSTSSPSGSSSSDPFATTTISSATAAQATLVSSASRRATVGIVAVVGFVLAMVI